MNGSTKPPFLMLTSTSIASHRSRSPTRMAAVEPMTRHSVGCWRRRKPPSMTLSWQRLAVCASSIAAQARMIVSGATRNSPDSARRAAQRVRSILPGMNCVHRMGNPDPDTSFFSRSLTRHCVPEITSAEMPAAPAARRPR